MLSRGKRSRESGWLAGWHFTEDLRFVWDHLPSTAIDEDRQFASD